MKVTTKIKKKLVDEFQMSYMGDVSLVLEMKAARDRLTGRISVSQEKYTESILERSGMGICKPISTPGFGGELSVEQPGETLLNAEETKRLQAKTGSTMYLAQVSHATRHHASYLPACSDDVPAFQRSHVCGQPTSAFPCWT